MQRAPIKHYREFWDFPRCLLVEYREQSFLLDCRFNESDDEFEQTYSVYLATAIGPEQLRGTWDQILQEAVPLGRIPVDSVRFDVTKRSSIDATILEKLGRKHGLWEESTH